MASEAEEPWMGFPWKHLARTANDISNGSYEHLCAALQTKQEAIVKFRALILVAVAEVEFLLLSSLAPP